MRTLLVAFFSLFATVALAQQQVQPVDSCRAQVPWGTPPNTKADVTPICRMGYFALHDNQAKIPVWVSYVLTSERAIGCYPREDAFAPDQSIPKGRRAELSDYYKSGYDIGHVANNADMSWHPGVQRESFILSNMYPQLPGLNRGIWKMLETAARSWAWGRQTNLTIMSGAIYDINNTKKIGANGVVVPSGFWKIIIDNNTKETLAFIFPHQEGLGSDLTKVQVTVADIEKVIGAPFSVPSDKNVKVPLWPTFSKAMADEKKKVCKGS